MLSFTSLPFTALSLLSLAFAINAPLELITRDITPSIAKVQGTLGPKLCKGTSLYFPGSPEFGNYTTRWSTAAEGHIDIVVVPACDKDVATAVKFANVVSLPFLAINRGHGSTTTLGTIKHGILIKLDNLDSIEVDAKANTATLGGGVYIDQVLAKLAEYGKVCSSGSCGCVGMVGPGLGGGFGKYMGYAGLIADNFIELDVTTADGNQITVCQTAHPDLFWAMRGAGHNFGIVTKFKYHIFDYPKGPDTYYATYFFTGDKLEAFFILLNKLLDNGKIPKDANTNAGLLSNPALSPKPILLFQFYYFGTEAQALPFLQPFLDLGPIVTSNDTTPYKNIAHEALQAGLGDPVCAPGTTKALFPVGLKAYNSAASQKIYDLFVDMITKYPALNGSIVQLEGYALEGVKAIDPASTAYAHRDDNILVSFTTLYPPSTENDAIAARYGREARRLWIEGEKGTQFNAYVNYAYGDETVQQIYGYEPWRIQKLRGLKKKWDPKGKFNFYNPIL